MWRFKRQILSLMNFTRSSNGGCITRTMKAPYGYIRIEEMAKRVLPADFLPFVFQDEKAVNNFVSRMKARLVELGTGFP